MNVILCTVLKCVEKKSIQNRCYGLNGMKTAIGGRAYTVSCMVLYSHE
jgi:hypothetical protein